MQAVRQWCTSHKALVICDEVQAGFGRTGTLWGFEHYGMVPDLALFGKGMASSLPISAVAGRRTLMDLHPAGSMTSTDTGNPVCCAAALASLDLVVTEDLAGNARRMGTILQERLRALQSRFPQIGSVDGKGVVAGSRVRGAGHAIAGRRPSVAGGGALRREGRADVQPRTFRRRHGQDLASAGNSQAAIRESVAVLEEAFSEIIRQRAAAA